MNSFLCQQSSIRSFTFFDERPPRNFVTVTGDQNQEMQSKI